MSYNVLSVSEVPRRGIWAECRRYGARYALLGDVVGLFFMTSFIRKWQNYIFIFFIAFT
jgi:hypothetical protein